MTTIYDLIGIVVRRNTIKKNTFRTASINLKRKAIVQNLG